MEHKHHAGGNNSSSYQSIMPELGDGFFEQATFQHERIKGP
jgi:hypothetical protein